MFPLTSSPLCPELRAQGTIDSLQRSGWRLRFGSGVFRHDDLLSVRAHRLSTTSNVRLIEVSKPEFWAPHLTCGRSRSTRLAHGRSNQLDSLHCLSSLSRRPFRESLPRRDSATDPLEACAPGRRSRSCVTACRLDQTAPGRNRCQPNPRTRPILVRRTRSERPLPAENGIRQRVAAGFRRESFRDRSSRRSSKRCAAMLQRETAATRPGGRNYLKAFGFERPGSTT